MHNVYWMYEGYSGDCFGFAQRAENLVARFAPQGKSTIVRCFSYLTQRGYGPGYFNNSGVYFQFQRTTFKTEALRDAALELMKHYCVKVYTTEAEYKEAIADRRLSQNVMRKSNPF
jgi:hypothetical protein